MGTFSVRPLLRPPVRKTITFTGAANFGQATTSVTVFTVTGKIHVVSLEIYCTVNLGEAAPTATVTLATATQAAFFIAATNSVDIDAGDVWTAAGPTTRSLALPAGFKDISLNDNIIMACAAQDTNAGALEFTLVYFPISIGALAI